MQAVRPLTLVERPEELLPHDFHRHLFIAAVGHGSAIDRPFAGGGAVEQVLPQLNKPMACTKDTSGQSRGPPFQPSNRAAAACGTAEQLDTMPRRTCLSVR